MTKNSPRNEKCSHFFCWPLSAKLDIEIEKCVENNGNLIKVAEKELEKMELNLFAIS
jgi:hypothetical protein